MDPLGAASAIVTEESIPLWHSTPVPEYNIMVDDQSKIKQSPFKYSQEINKKVALWSGDVSTLSVEAIVNPTNESLSDRNNLTDRIMKQAGPQLKQELRKEIRGSVRRFLERFSESVQKIIFVPTGSDQDVYLSLLPLYFPRSKSEEEFAAYHLPYDVGNEDGEPVIAERQIRIIGKPTIESQRAAAVADYSELEETVNINEAFDMSVAVGAHDFAKMKGDVDKEKKQRLHGAIEKDVVVLEQERRYDRWLRRARQTDLIDVKQYNCIYQSGCDRHGRPVLMIIGRHFPGQRINNERLLLYALHVMDTIVQQSYVVVYVHTLVTRDNQPHSDFLSDLYNLTDKKYKRNLKHLYIVHPNFWTKILTWFFTTFSVSDIKDKVCYIPGLEYLYSRVGPDQLELPNWVLDYDMQVNGTRYYDPDQDEAIGAL